MVYRAIYFSTYAASKHYLMHDLAINRGQESPLVQLISAAAAGIATGTATNPVWVVKTRMQLQAKRFESHQPSSSPSTNSAINTSASTVTPKRSSVASLSSSSKSSRHRLPNNSPFVASQHKDTSIHHMHRITKQASVKPPTAITANASYSTLPSTCIRSFSTQLSSTRPLASVGQEAPYYRNSFDCLLQICRYEGVRGLFRGLSASYLGIMEGTIQWIAYEQLKKWAMQPDYASTTQQDPSSSSSATTVTSSGKLQPQNSAMTVFVNTLGTAGVAKFIATVTTYPHEVLRTRLRQVAVETHIDASGREMAVSVSKYKGIMDVLRTVMREEGALAFYGGMTAHLLRTVPNTAIMFCCYESIVYFFKED
jgi:solute carrier family 25 protein 33/36